jgi:putative glutamine amidotransferase
MLKDIATYAGSGTEIVQDILHDLGARLQVIDTFTEAQSAHFDGLILLGGCDIGPSLYGENVTFAHAPNKYRDRIEWFLVRHALSRGKPVFGICRGHQMLAVACGGSLWQDIHSERAKTKHRPKHKLVKVSKILGKHLPTTSVNSYHHQAIRHMPLGFKILARAPDMVVEAIWSPGLLGVQWHPEFLYTDDPRWDRLFSWFVKERLR